MGGYFLGSWSKTRIFAASTITQYWLDNTIIIFFISDNATIIYWMKEANSKWSVLGINFTLSTSSFSYQSDDNGFIDLKMFFYSFAEIILYDSFLNRSSSVAENPSYEGKKIEKYIKEHDKSKHQI